MVAKFGYWNLQGLGQPIRNLLHLAGEEYEEKTYIMGTAPDFDMSDWLNDKFTLGLRYPNLPYYIDGDLKLTQSLAILRHLARKHNLTAKNASEQPQVDMIEQQLIDYKRSLYMSVIHPRHAIKMKEYKTNLPQMFKPFSDLFQGKPWMMGDRITYLDVMAHDVLLFNLAIDKDSLDALPNLKDFVTRFEAIPKLKKYFATDVYKSYHIVNEEWYEMMRKS